MPTLPFVSGTFFDQPVDRVPGVGRVVDGGRVQRPAQGAVHHVVALRAVLAADVLKDPDVAREGHDVVGRRDHRLQSGARRAGGRLVGVVGGAGEEDRHLAGSPPGACGAFGTRITVCSFTPSRIAISTSRRWWSKLPSATLNSAGMSPPGGTASSCGVSEGRGGDAGAGAGSQQEGEDSGEPEGRVGGFAWSFADRVGNCGSAQAEPSPAWRYAEDRYPPCGRFGSAWPLAWGGYPRPAVRGIDSQRTFAAAPSPDFGLGLSVIEATGPGGRGETFGAVARPIR